MPKNARDSVTKDIQVLNSERIVGYNTYSNILDKEKIMAANDDALSTKKTTKGETETSKADDEEFLAKLIALCAKKT